MEVELGAGGWAVGGTDADCACGVPYASPHGICGAYVAVAPHWSAVGTGGGCPYA
jgi:hypothetical protein